MPYTRIWIHLIWATKNRQPFLRDEIRSKVFMHIRENSKKQSIYLDHINGWVEHVHTIISLKANQSVAQVAHLLKGESSNWINKSKLTRTKFGWQDEYIAVSVSESMLNKVRKYIRNQENHHRKKSFSEEYQEFIEKYGFRKDKSERD